MKKKYKGLQFVNWFPKWKGFAFGRWKGTYRYIYDWSLVLGFWEIRRWQPKSFEEIKAINKIMR